MAKIIDGIKYNTLPAKDRFTCTDCDLRPVNCSTVPCEGIIYKKAPATRSHFYLHELDLGKKHLPRLNATCTAGALFALTIIIYFVFVVRGWPF